MIYGSFMRQKTRKVVKYLVQCALCLLDPAVCVETLVMRFDNLNGPFDLSRCLRFLSSVGFF